LIYLIQLLNKSSMSHYNDYSLISVVNKNKKMIGETSTQSYIEMRDQKIKDERFDAKILTYQWYEDLKKRRYQIKLEKSGSKRNKKTHK